MINAKRIYKPFVFLFIDCKSTTFKWEIQRLHRFFIKKRINKFAAFRKKYYLCCLKGSFFGEDIVSYKVKVRIIT